MRQSFCLRSLAAGLCLLLIFPCLSSAQALEKERSLDPSLALTQYILDTWTTDDGLPQNTIHAIAQTPDGYLWVSTQEGLARFDGHTFTLFSKKNTSAFSNNDILSLLVDRTGALWIGTNGGGLLRYRDHHFDTFTTADGLVSNHIGSLYEDGDGRIWIGTREGLSYFDDHRFTSLTTADGLAGNHVMSIHGDAQGIVWIGTIAGMSTYREGQLGQDPRWAGEVILTVFSDSQGALWVGTETNLQRHDGDQKTVFTDKEGLVGTSGLSLYEDRAGTLWVGTESGLNRFDGVRFETLSTANGLNDDVVWSIFEDREGSLWFGTTSGGLHQLKDLKFTTLTTSEGLPSDLTTAVLEDASGVLWIGTDGNGLARHAPDGTITTFSTADGLPDDYITALASTPDGSLWIGTWGGGLTRFHNGRFNTFTTAHGLTHDNILVIYPDHDGTLWIGTVEGITRYRNGRFDTFTAEHGLHNEVVWTLLRDTNGVLWAGTQQGLHRYDGDTHFTAFTKEDGLLSDYILSMHSDAEGTLWLATWGGGLIRYHEGTFDAWTAEEGLPSDNIFAILEDNGGDLWLTGNLGITRVSKSELASFFAKGTPVSTTLYDRSDGLRSKECSGGSQPAAWKAQDGTLWFPTVKGVAAINPDHIRLNEVPPPVVIETVTDGDGQIVPEDILLLPAGHNNLSIRYAGLSLLQPGENRFMYQLEGEDEKWVEAGSRQTAYYTNLAPGTYRFRVQARNNDGIWSSHEARLQIEIAPFFYQSIYFYLLMAVGIGFIGLTSYRMRVRHLQHQAEALAQLVEERTHDIRIAKEKTEQAKAIIESQAQELKDLNYGLEQQVDREVKLRIKEREQYEATLLAAKERAEASSRFKTAIMGNMNHEFRTPLTAITSAVQILGSEVSHDLKPFVDIAEKNGSRLLQTLNGLLQLSDIEARHYELDIEPTDLRSVIQSVADALTLKADVKDLHLRVALPAAPVVSVVDKNAFKHLFHHILENAIKFTDAGQVEVAISRAEKGLAVTVKDTGIGISKAFLPHIFEAFRQESEGMNRRYEGSGLGLTIAQRLASMMHMKLHIQSQHGQGTTATIFIQDKAQDPAPRPQADRRSRPGISDLTSMDPIDSQQPG